MPGFKVKSPTLIAAFTNPVIMRALTERPSYRAWHEGYDKAIAEMRCAMIQVEQKLVRCPVCCQRLHPSPRGYQLHGHTKDCEWAEALAADATEFRDERGVE